MTAMQAEVESQAITLATEAFKAFCEDISGMFGVTVNCTPHESGIVSVDDLNKQLTKLLAVNSVEAKGALNGGFQLIFDQSGLFTTAGVIVMLPERSIRAEIKRGTIEDSDSMNDAIKEIGNLLVGSWDRVFREKLEGHGHFKQTTVFVGDPWDDPEEKLGLVADEEYVFVPHEMTIEPYPSFQCGVIFPKDIFVGVSESQSDDEAQEGAEGDSEQAEGVVDGQDGVSEEDGATANDSEKQANPERSLEETRHFSFGDGVLSDFLSARAEDIMDKDVVWGSPEDSVQDALAKMQDHNTGYLMVGDEGVLDGIVSNSNISGAISLYLRPVFAKWRRPLDDATLNVKIKWVMTRPVHAAGPDSPLAVVIDDMRKFGTRCMPIVDEGGQVLGIVTAFDIFNALNGNTDISSIGKPAQAPPMVVEK